MVQDALNAEGAATAKDRAMEALKKMERASADTNAAWPDDSRFHFEMLDVAPALVVKVSFRTNARYFVFGIPENFYGTANRLWKQVGEDEESIESNESKAPRTWISLYPLHRGPSGKARFLASFGFTGCAGSGGLEYDAGQWDPKNDVEVEQVVKVRGALGMDEEPDGRRPTAKQPFAPIGKLKTDGLLITLPYCFWSGIDFWDNPSLCALDTFDVSGNQVRFHSRTYNRPELVPIAKAMEFAEKQDYQALLGYCATPDLAARLVRDGAPGRPEASDPQVTRKGDGTAHVKFDAGSYFDVAKRGGRWVLAGYGEDLH
jgi:hypothetical protein